METHTQNIRVKTLFRNIFIDVKNVQSLTPNRNNSKLIELALKDNSKPYLLNRKNATILANVLINKGLFINENNGLRT